MNSALDRGGACSATRRWIFDLQACQTTGSAHRGVGRYSQALFETMRALHPEVDVRVVKGEALPHPVSTPGLSAERVIHLPALPGLGARRYNGGTQDDLDALLFSHRLAEWKPDLVHVSHVFEGFQEQERVALPAPALKPPGQVHTATLYDLIPLRFPGAYFQSPEFERWYRSRLDWLRKADLLLAISESSRQDAIDLLGVDPTRVVTVHGGISEQFVPPEDRTGVREDLLRRYGLRGRFALYTGGDDHRKNVAGAIRGYAAVPVESRRDCQFVVVCSMEASRRAMYTELGRQAGLAPQDLVITGFVPESDLVAFYQCCDVFVFPSLYEGLGLPILEAMACGAPVVAGDNSSLRELVGRQDAMFDAASDAAIGRAIAGVLDNASFAAELASYGKERSRLFTWSRTASIASQAFGDATRRAGEAGLQVAHSGWLPKRRLAVLSPLPPARSGIADYNAKFLPYLARHFEIDLYVDGYEIDDITLASTFAVFDARRFEAVGHLYDAILYEFGNSEFHRFMLPLLERFPGVVGLHDAYLSGLYGYLDFHVGDAGSYPRSMIAMHGPRARRFYAPAMNHPEPNGGTMVELPCTKKVLDGAIGIISHSPFNLEVARRNFPEGWQAPYRTIPQMVQRPGRIDALARQRLRDELGFPAEVTLIATFGHIAWTKWGDRLLDAFLSSTLAENPHIHLVFVGELADDAFGRQVAERIAQSGRSARIQVTGFLPEQDYERFLQITDIAIQLRTKSRGGTPKGVLDCLAHGVPVVVNEDASYRDYPDDIVFKLVPDPDSRAIATALEALCRAPAQRESLSSNGLRYVREHHNPESCASQYAAAIHEFVERERAAANETTLSAVAPLVARADDELPLVRSLAQFLGARQPATFRRRRIFIDVSFIAVHDHESGIQRVVKKIVHHLYTTDTAGVEPIAVQLSDGRLHVASQWLKVKGLLHPNEVDSIEPDRTVVFAPGDILLMLDSSWDRYREFLPYFDEARQHGTLVATVVFDLLPMVLPASSFVEGGPAWFKDWFVNGAVNVSDVILTISAAVAKDIHEFARSEPSLKRRPCIGYWHLGSDIAFDSARGPHGAGLSKVFDRPYLLVVGTIEPRKSHALLLDAMESLWARGDGPDLCIAGKKGWLVDDLMDRLHSHPELGRRLHLFENPSDSDITHLYDRADGLLLLSRGEGFGLPLVEAANHGTPILCSDLPVFREVCGDYATYISGWQPAQISSQIAAWWRLRQAGQVPETHDMPRLTWEQSAQALLDVIVNEKWIY